MIFMRSVPQQNYCRQLSKEVWKSLSYCAGCCVPSVSTKSSEIGPEPEVVHLSNNKRTVSVADFTADLGAVSGPAEMKRFR